jgi:hypothetical protein
MTRIPLLVVMFVVLAVPALADLGDYPAPFVPGTPQIIVGSEAPGTDALAATEIALALQKKLSANLDSEFDASRNGIIIGQPCKNTVVAELLGTSACNPGLPSGAGYLKLVDRDGWHYLVVSGASAEGTRKAARVLGKYDSYALSGEEMLVTGTLGVPSVIELSEPLDIVEPECVVDGGCAFDEWCNSSQCQPLECGEGAIAEAHDCVPVEPVEEDVPVAEQAPVEQAPVKPAVADGSEPEGNVPELEEEKSFVARILDFFRQLF